MIASFVSMLVWSLMLFVKNNFPEQNMFGAHSSSSLKRFAQTAKIAWVALLPGFSYGFLEANLHAVFPFMALKLVMKLISLLLLFRALH